MLASCPYTPPAPGCTVCYLMPVVLSAASDGSVVLVLVRRGGVVAHDRRVGGRAGVVRQPGLHEVRHGLDRGCACVPLGVAESARAVAANGLVRQDAVFLVEGSDGAEPRLVAVARQ